MNKRKWYKRIEPRMLVPILLGIMFTLGDAVSNQNGSIFQSGKAIFIKAILFCALFCVCFYFAGVCVTKLRQSCAATKQDKRDMRVSFSHAWSFSNWLKDAIVIGLCWIPYVFLLFPGVYWSDTSKQLLMHYGAVDFTDHHPFATTYLFGWFVDFGQWAFNNPIFGLYLLIVAQLIAAPLIFSWMILYTRRMGLSRKLCNAELAFFALFPVFPVMFSSLAKDTISVLFFIPFCLLFVDVIRTKGESMLNPGVIVAILLCGLLTCLSKKAGVYMVVPSLLLMFLIHISKKAKAIAFSIGAAIAIIMMVIVPKIIMPALNVEPGGKQESIPFAIQQVAHDIKYNAEDMTPQEKKLVSDFLTIDYNQISKVYNSLTVDPVKGDSLKNPNLFDDFIKLWLKKTVEHPIGHLEAWLGLVQGGFSFSNNDGSPNYMVVCTESAWYYDPILKYVPQWPLEASHSDAARSVYNTEQSIPVLNVLFSRALWASILPCFMLYLALRPGTGKWHRVASMLPVDMSFVYLLLVPISGGAGEPTRYVLQLICVAPLFLTLMLACQKEKAES